MGDSRQALNRQLLRILLGEMGLSAVAFAVIKNRLDLVQLLVSTGAEINLVDDDGYSILDLAYQNNRPKIAEYLEELGAKSGREIKERQIGIKAKKLIL